MFKQIKVLIKLITRQPLTDFTLYVIIFISFLHLYSLQTSRYDYIERSMLPYELYKKIIPSLKINRSILECNYHTVISRQDSESTKEHPRKISSSFIEDFLINGSFVPNDCTPLFSVAIIVSYRDRKEQLDIFLPYMHRFLMQQNIHYKIFIVEQQDSLPWNKGILYNIGAKFAMAEHFPCLIFHDVDIIPLDYANIYACTGQPRHMSVRIDKFRFELLYPELFGGAVAMKADQFVDLNGYSNMFDDWGAEDSEISDRLRSRGHLIHRFAPDMNRYANMIHKHQPINNKNQKVRWSTDSRTDGLNTVDKFVMEINTKGNSLYTWIGVKRLLD